jgi:hypothetical protein
VIHHESVESCPAALTQNIYKINTQKYFEILKVLLFNSRILFSFHLIICMRDTKHLQCLVSNVLECGFISAHIHSTHTCKSNNRKQPDKPSAPPCSKRCHVWLPRMAAAVALGSLESRPFQLRSASLLALMKTLRACCLISIRARICKLLPYLRRWYSAPGGADTPTPLARVHAWPGCMPATGQDARLHAVQYLTQLLHRVQVAEVPLVGAHVAKAQEPQ